MSDKETIRMIEAYNQSAEPTLFFSGFFQSPPRNFYDAQSVEFDIVRSDEDISIAVTDMTTGYRANSADDYTNKKFTAPVHKESFSLDSYELINRMPGQDPFADINFRANLIGRFFGGMTKIERKIRRSIELQASQVLQTGTALLTDENGVAIYSINYSPKATHFPTSAIAWNAVGATIVSDISSLAEIIRNDGLDDPDQLIMGIDAFEAFIADPAIIQRFETRRIDLGSIAPMQPRGKGASFRGVVNIGNYMFDVWTYAGRYKHPQTGVKTQYLDPAKVIVRSSGGRLDATFGGIPNIGQILNVNSISIPGLPNRVSNVDGGTDMFTNVWLTEGGEQLMGGVGTRPLYIPTAIDTYGCLDTGV